MRIRVLAIINDTLFGRTLAEKLARLNMAVLAVDDEQQALEILSGQEMDVVLLDIRPSQRKNAMAILSSIKKIRPGAEIILIAGAEDIALSMAGMRNGAADDITVPFDIDRLADKIRSASQRSLAKTGKRQKRSFLKIFEDAMMAATFAQAGEFESARKIDSGEFKTNKTEKKKDENEEIPG